MKNNKLLFLLLSFSFFFSFCTLGQVKTTGLTLDQAMKIPLAAEGVIIDCTKEKIERLPEDFSKLTKLYRVAIMGNATTTFDFADAFEKMSKLPLLTSIWIDGFGPKLTNIPESIGLLKQLEELTLSKIDIENIPVAICQLEKLVYLSIEETKITSVPVEIKKLVNLETLSLQDNQINSGFEAIYPLTKITDLELANNKIPSIPEGISKLKNMSRLNLSKNPLTDVPNEIDLIDTMEYLVVVETNIPEERMKSMKKNFLMEVIDEYGCFPSGSLVSMADGSLKPIEMIRSGEKVKSYDVEKKIFKTSKIIALQTHNTTYYHVYKVQLKIPNSSVNLSSQLFNTESCLTATGNHPVYVKNEGWKNVENLKTGDVLVYADDNQNFCKEAFVGSINLSVHTVPAVYNLDVKKENYFVNGVLVNYK